jgi:hypothetical protein
MDVSIAITVDYNSSHIEFLLDSQYPTISLLVLGLLCSLQSSTTHYDSQLSLSLSLSPMLRPMIVGHSVLKQSTHLGLTARSSFMSDSCGFVDVGRSLSLSFVITAGPRQRIHSRVRVPLYSRPYYRFSATTLDLTSREPNTEHSV